MVKKMLTTSLIAVAILAACSLQNLPPLPTRSASQKTDASAAEDKASAATTTDTTARTEESGEPVPRELAERLIGYYGFGSPEPIEPELLVGKLPLDLAFLPVPLGATVLGGVVRGDTGSEAILDTKQDPKDVLAFYADQLKASGWTTPTVNMMAPGGFVSAEQATSNYFCKSEDGPSLSINARGLAEGTTDVRLTYTTQKGMGFGFGSCKTPPGAMIGSPFQQLPSLTAPRGAQQIGGGGGGASPDRFWTSTTLVTTMTVTVIQDHYAAQLEAAGWTRDDAGSSGPVAWSRWTSKDAQGKSQNGLLFVLEEGKETPQRFVYLQVSAPGASGSAVRETFTQIVRTAP